MAAQHAAAPAQQAQGASILVRSVENILRHLARLLVGKMTLRRIQSIFREVFIQEAEAHLRKERPGKNVPLSQLALLSGLDTRTLIRIRGELAARQASGERGVRISDLSAEAKVVEMWALNPDFRDPQTGKPRVLDSAQFESLVRQVVTSRGVTVQSILERLTATNSVVADDESGNLQLLTERFSPFNTEDELSLMNNGLQSIINLSNTVCSNVQSPQDQRYIQRELWTFRLDEARREEFREKVREFLLHIENDAERVMVPMESEFEYEDQVTAGLGFYYFEEEG